MSRNKLVFLIGILLSVMPFLGFPPAWKTGFYVSAGLILILMAVIGHMRRRSREVLSGSRDERRV